MVLGEWNREWTRIYANLIRVLGVAFGSVFFHHEGTKDTKKKTFLNRKFSQMDANFIWIIWCSADTVFGLRRFDAE